MRILIIVHGFPPLAQGGTEVYAHAQALALAARGHSVYVLARESDPTRPERAIRHESRDGLAIRWINNTFADARSFADTYTDDRIDALAGAIIDDIRPDVAHIHHLTCLSTTIVDELWIRDVPVIVTLHDYWLMCHRGQLLDLDLRPCDGPSASGCARCIGSVSAAPASAFRARASVARLTRPLPAFAVRPLVAVARRLAATTAAGDSASSASMRRTEHMRDVLSRVSSVIAPSRFMRDRFVAFGISAEKVVVSELGVDPGKATKSPGPRAEPGALRIGYLGSLMVSKAPHVLLEACRLLPTGSVEVEVVGQVVDYHGDDRYRARITPLLALPFVRHLGTIPHDQVASWLASIDVLAVPSIWPENSPLVIREAFVAGVPVIASRIGGIPEVITDERNGLLIQPGDVHGWERGLRRLIDDPDLLPRLRRGLPPVRTSTDDVDATRTRYAEIAAAVRPRRRLAAVVLNYKTPDETLLAVRALRRSLRPIDDLIVVNNGEPGECDELLRPLRDELRVIDAHGNLGYPGGMNLGIRAALSRGADQVLLVNSDVVASPEAVGVLERAIGGRAGVGIAGPVVLDRQAPDVMASLGMSYDRRTGRMRHRAVGVGVSSVDLPGLVPTAGVSGCFILIRRDVFDRIGLLDEDYFFGFEDLDFCLRAADAEIRTVVVPRARVFHEGGRSMGPRAPIRLYYGARNHLRAARRAAGRVGWARSAFLSAWVTVLNVAHAVRAPGGSLGARLAAVGRGAMDGVRGRVGPAPHR